MTKAPKVWVIDDDRSIRWVLERALRKAEMDVTCFSNGVGVMDILERDQPDAILSDVRMPGIDGLELLGQITARYPSLPVIIMTAHSDLDSAVSAFHGGAFEYLPKPFDLDEAVAQVRRACRHQLCHHLGGNPFERFHESEQCCADRSGGTLRRLPRQGPFADGGRRWPARSRQQ